MTESERIIKSQLLPENYLKEEWRDDFYVDEQRKKIWAIELDMLMVLDAICKKYEIKYFLLYGSLLGAVRHGGFIPWDDDLDIGVMRDDFEKLVEVLCKKLKHPYFLQTPYTDPGSAFSMARLRNSNTTALIHAFEYETFNQGIPLDIFALDNCILEGHAARYEEIKRITMNGSAYMRRNNPMPTVRDKEILSAYTRTDPITNYEKLYNLCNQYNMQKTEYISTLVITTYPWEKELFYAEDFREVIYTDFEGLKFPIPSGYNRILKTTYGDYMKFPPKEERGKWHTRTTFYDPDMPYTAYI